MLRYATFGYSKDLYALDPSTFRVIVNKRTGSYVYTVEAVWFTRRKATNRRAVKKGQAYSTSPYILTYAEFLEKERISIDGSVIWDGEEIWGLTKLKDQVAAAAYLDPILQQGPDLLQPWDGWFEIVEK
jgi:hypothetical protein